MQNIESFIEERIDYFFDGDLVKWDKDSKYYCAGYTENEITTWYVMTDYTSFSLTLTIIHEKSVNGIEQDEVLEKILLSAKERGRELKVPPIRNLNQLKKELKNLLLRINERG